VECIGKARHTKPYEFGVKVSVATTLKHSKGGQFVVHAQALPGNPYDGHTLAASSRRSSNSSAIRSNGSTPMPDTAATTRRRVQVQNLYVQASGRDPQIKREMKPPRRVDRSSAILKEYHRMDRNYLATVTATSTTPSSPPPATTSAA